MRYTTTVGRERDSFRLWLRRSRQTVRLAGNDKIMLLIVCAGDVTKKELVYRSYNDNGSFSNDTIPGSRYINISGIDYSSSYKRQMLPVFLFGEGGFFNMTAVFRFVCCSDFRALLRRAAVGPFSDGFGKTITYLRAASRSFLPVPRSDVAAAGARRYSEQIEGAYAAGAARILGEGPAGAGEYTPFVRRVCWAS